MALRERLAAAKLTLSTKCRISAVDPFETLGRGCEPFLVRLSSLSIAPQQNRFSPACVDEIASSGCQLRSPLGPGSAK